LRLMAMEALARCQERIKSMIIDVNVNKLCCKMGCACYGDKEQKCSINGQKRMLNEQKYLKNNKNDGEAEQNLPRIPENT